MTDRNALDPIEKASRDELVAAKGRPYTQGPIRKRRQVDDPDMGGLTTLDGVLAEHLRRMKEESE